MQVNHLWINSWINLKVANQEVVVILDNHLTLGNNIDLALLAGNTTSGIKRFKATGNPASLIIHVGNATGRVALAQSLFTVANGSFDAGTTIAI